MTSVGSAGSNPAEPRINLPAGPPAAGAPTTGRNPMTQPAELRDRIRRVLCERDGQAALWGTDMLEPDEYGADADAVLAVLPASAGRAAALTEAADWLDADMERFFQEWPDEPRNSPYANGRKDATAELRRLAAEAHDGDTQDDGALRAKVEEATATLRRLRAVAKDWKQRVLPHSQAHRLFVEVRDALAGPRPDDDGPLTEEQIVRNHVTTVHLIGEQLADVESWLWERLAEVREAPSAVLPVGSAEPQDETRVREVVHGCPPDGSGLTPCCGRTPFELPRTDRISSEAPVTCAGGEAPGG